MLSLLHLLRPQIDLTLLSAAATVPASQPDWLQEPGNPQLQEGQRGCQQQDEVHQDRAIQHHRGCALRPGGVLLCRLQKPAHPDRHALPGS